MSPPWGPCVPIDPNVTSSGTSPPLSPTDPNVTTHRNPNSPTDPNVPIHPHYPPWDITHTLTPMFPPHGVPVSSQTPMSPPMGSLCPHRPQCHLQWDITHPPTPWGPCVPMDPDVPPSGTSPPLSPTDPNVTFHRDSVTPQRVPIHQCHPPWDITHTLTPMFPPHGVPVSPQTPMSPPLRLHPLAPLSPSHRPPCPHPPTHTNVTPMGHHPPTDPMGSLCPYGPRCHPQWDFTPTVTDRPQCHLPQGPHDPTDPNVPIHPHNVTPHGTSPTQQPQCHPL